MTLLAYDQDVKAKIDVNFAVALFAIAGVVKYLFKIVLYIVVPGAWIWRWFYLYII